MLSTSKYLLLLFSHWILNLFIPFTMRRLQLYENKSGNAALVLLKMYLTLSLLCNIVEALDNDLAPVIPLNGKLEHEICQTTCHSKICGDEALRFVKLIDEQVDPCSNFYEFVCGGYLKSVASEEGDSSVVSEIQGGISEDTNTEVTADITDRDSEAYKKTKIYYQNCINEDLTERAGSRPLLETLNKIGGWPVLLDNRWNERGYNWVETLYKINEERFPEIYLPATITVMPDNTDASKNAIKINSVPLNIASNYFIDPKRSDTIMNAYLNSMIQTAVALGARNDSKTRRELRQVMEFEWKLYNITTPPEQLAEMDDGQFTIAELSSRYPGIPWLEFINEVLKAVRITVDEREKVYVMDTNFVSEVTQLIRTTPKRILANYLGWRVASSSTGYMSKQFTAIDNEFKSVLEGTQETEIRTSMCFEETVNSFPISISAMYVKKYFDKAAASPISEMFSDMKSVFRKNLEQVDWMDESTRRAALEKLEMMNVTVGFSKEILDDNKVNGYYEDLQLNPGLYIQSAFNVSYFIRNQVLKKLRNFSVKDRWMSKQSAAVFNAYNVPPENSVEIPAGFIKGMYKQGRPQYINYGSLGAVVGHEIIHGFDNKGRKYDKFGNQVSWWQPDTDRKFREKGRCLVEQYGNFTIPEINMNVNGQLTLGENIADNGGFRLAYLAYNEWGKRNNIVESCLPSMNYTPQQMFWISTAAGWCSKSTPPSLKNDLTNEHSPELARIIVTFSNYKEFAEDFNCPLGSRMNPVKKCTIW